MAFEISCFHAHLERSKGHLMPTPMPTETEIETDRKRTDKMYRWHTGYIGGLKEVRADEMLKSHPERAIEWAVQGMLPKNRLGRAMAKKLKVYRGKEHPHAAQQPQAMPAARG